MSESESGQDSCTAGGGCCENALAAAAAVPKVRVRSSGPRRPQPTALDKQYRHVAIIQRKNRAKVAEQQQQQQERERRERHLSDFSHKLRTAILGGDASTIAATWQPAAAAAQLQQLQQQAAADGQARHRLVAAASACDAEPSSNTAGSGSSEPQLEGPQDVAVPSVRSRTHGTPTGNGGGDGENEDDEDVDAFLDGLLQMAAASQAAEAESASVRKTAATAAAVPPAQAGARAQRAASPAAAAAGGCCPGTAPGSVTKQRSRPAWALTQQQQAAADAAGEAAECAEEAELLGFAEGLQWEQLVTALDDEQLAAAFQELETAEQLAAAGSPAADREWRRCFVAALNHTAMQNVAAATAAAAAAGLAAPAAAADAGAAWEGKSDGGASNASSTTRLRRAAATAERRQKLLCRLSRLGGGGSQPGGSCWGSGDTAGNRPAAAAGPAATGAVEWDGSTRAGADDVAAQLSGVVRALDAGEALAEHPELRGVHSVASVRSLLTRVEGSAASLSTL